VRYRVLFQPTAAAELDEAARWIARDSPGRAARWLKGAQRAVRGLARFPRRCPLARENEAFTQEIRQLLYGEYRILFAVIEDQVHVLHVQHGARQHLEPDEAPATQG
jgi:plasmid stabilization system protein ParE